MGVGGEGGDSLSTFSFVMSMVAYGLAVYLYVIQSNFNAAVISYLVGLQVSVWGIANKLNTIEEEGE